MSIRHRMSKITDLSLIHFSESSKHKWLCLACTSMFLMWSLLDFLIQDSYSAIFFFVRFLIFSVTLLFVSDLNNKLFNKYHRLITSIILTFVTVSTTYFILLSTRPLVNCVYLVLLSIILPNVFTSRVRFFLPVILIPFAVYLTGNFYISDSISYNITALIATSALITLISAAQYLSHLQLKSAQRNYKELEKSKTNIDELLAENSQLIRILCHDLGNAITIIDMSTTLMTDSLKELDTVPVMYKKNIDRVKRAVTTQKEIIEHVREKEALESGKCEIVLQPVNLSIIFEKAKFIFHEQLTQKNLNLNIKYINDEAPFVAAEMVSLSNNVINNLLSNAIKFSNDNSEVTITSKTIGEEILVIIEDQGIGMNKELSRDIFKTNIKTSRLGVNGEKGTGFGVPLVKSYMLKYGGDIAVESIENQGTKFTLRFKSIQSLEGNNFNQAS